MRTIVGEVLETRRELSQDFIRATRDQYLAEKQLVLAPTVEVAPLGDDGQGDTAGEPLRLLSLKDCKGVNALAESQEIVFNPKMTVLFGENATGKTGYVRVIKRLSNCRSAEPIIADIHQPSQASPAEAVVTYSVGEEQTPYNWHNESGVAPFTRISVFDSPSVALHLEEDVTYLYTPAELALFKQSHAAIEQVRALLETDLAARRPRQNPFITAFTRGSALYPKIESLGGSTDLAELAALAVITAEDTTTLETLKLSIEALTGTSTQGRVEMLSARASLVRNLVTIGESFLAFNGESFATAVEAELRARQQQEAAAADVFGGEDLPPELRASWQGFIQAAERFLSAENHQHYPTADDVCVYCRQPLSEEAVALLSSYREFARGTTEAAVVAAVAAVDSAQTPLVSGDVSAAIDGLRAILPEVQESEQAPEWAADGLVLLGLVKSAVEGVRSRRAPEDSPFDTEALLARLHIALTETETALHSLEGDAQQRQRALADDRGRLALLEARVTLARLMPEIETHVQSAAWATKLSTLLLRFQALFRGLTDTSKAASALALNRDFERVFYQECEALRAPNVTLDFPGRKGEAARRKQVSAQHSLTKILSEGEQKVVAIADFLAETSLRSASAPVVFDDPVSSLDYRRLQEIVKRVVELCATQQVIVFTHDIWFVATILGHFEQRSSDINFYQVTERDGAKGFVTAGVHPRLDTPAQIKKKINVAIQDAGSATGDAHQTLVEAAYGLIRSWCEVVTEKDLLHATSQRFQPNVAMQNLRQIRTERLQTAIDLIHPVWEKANRYMPDHSQPLGTLGVRPTLTELKDDWAKVQAAHKAYTD